MNNIYLIGPMGAGKTTVGQLLATQLNYQFCDMDQCIAQQTKQSIAEIFQSHGEAHFRSLEYALLQQLMQQRNQVVATGGGIVLRAENRALLQQSQRIIYLQVSLAEQWRRIQQQPGARPLLDQTNPQTALHYLNQQRLPFYSELANYHYQSDTILPLELVKIMVQQLN